MIIEMFSYPFIVRAAVVGSLVALCAAILGVSLVLKRYSMIGDGLSHVGFGSLAVAALTGFAPMAVALPIVCIAAFFLLRINENKKIKGDSAVALISTGSLAVGVTLLSFSRGANVDLSSYMFGSILAIKQEDVPLYAILSFCVLILYIVFYNKFFAITFDSDFAASTGISTGFFDTLLAMMTAIVIVLGMRLTGALLISALIIFPSLIAMRFSRGFRFTVVISAAVSVSCYMAGLIASFYFDSPAGASVVLVNIFVLALVSGVTSLLQKIKK